MSLDPDMKKRSIEQVQKLLGRVFHRTPMGSELTIDWTKKSDSPRIVLLLRHAGLTGIVYRRPKILDLSDGQLEAAADEVAAELRKQVKA